jgi:hypothetical protein
VEPERPSVDDETNRAELRRTKPSSRSQLVVRSITIVAAVAMVMVVVANFISPDRSEPRHSQVASPPERGAACPNLKVAFDRWAANDAAGFFDATKSAYRSASKTLQIGDNVFGVPERVAIELFSLASKDGREIKAPKMDRLLETAKATCAKLGRW